MPPEQPTNADLKRSFDAHAAHDEVFQNDTRATDKGIQETLSAILDKLNPHHEQYINRGIEKRLGAIDNKLDPKHADYILKETNEQIALFNEIRDGIIFSRKALLWISSILGALAVIAASIIGTIRFIK